MELSQTGGRPMKYTVKNQYHESGQSTHRSIDRALDRKDYHEGLGWIVVDDKGNIWDRDFSTRPRITQHA